MCNCIGRYVKRKTQIIRHLSHQGVILWQTARYVVTDELRHPSHSPVTEDTVTGVTDEAPASVTRNNADYQGFTL